MSDLLLDSIVEGKPVKLTKNGKDICVARVGNEVFAIEDNCSHQDAALSEGEQNGYKIECWLHSAEFDLRTGDALTPPASQPVKTYPVLVDGNNVVVEI
ncbi:MAG: non-heme iron oxygenase ferredoxin subunit [Candidatus Nanopelagicaceae bacterium]|jgi:3-phenylpropionate/trans-cinnamate dioxygenase ferredoxin subunit